MNETDAIIICSMAAGLIAGIGAVFLFFASRQRLDLWPRYVAYATPSGFLTMAAAHWMAWYGLLIAVLGGGITFLTIWLDSRKKFPR